MLTLRGAPALTDFRRDQLLRAIRVHWPQATSIHCEYLHFVLTARELNPAERDRLDALLGTCQSDFDPADAGAIVMPRPGTLSPWSSKATDILHNCGMHAATRVERGVRWWFGGIASGVVPPEAVKALLHDPMTQIIVSDLEQTGLAIAHHAPAALRTIPLASAGRGALEKANQTLGLALNAGEIDYLMAAYAELKRDPTDAELMMFAQANSEHCRHKIFNATWIVDGVPQPHSLFDLIRHTHAKSPGRVLSAYKDNAAVMEGYGASRFFPDPDGVYRHHPEAVHLLAKVETHNHPTAISPFPGAATGAGGEIRDEAATGTGAKAKAGLTGFAVSNLHIPELAQPWEENVGRPSRIASALDIMIQGPIGAAAYNNEFGRPALCGYFRTLEQTDTDTGVVHGFHKPIMLAGGIGMVRPQHVHKRDVPAGSPIMVLGGPAMLIGLGGGAASSLTTGSSDAQLDFASVQRDNAEMQRRCQEVIDRCWAQGDENPILSIHDVGAGGLSNALPELVHGSGRGATFDLRKIPSADPGLSPLEIWCNEAQERYVLAIAPNRLTQFARLCNRERAPYAVLGHADASGQLRVEDARSAQSPVDMPLNVLLGKPPRMERNVRRLAQGNASLDLSGIDLATAVERVLQLPAVADKTFLITIGDRTVSGLVVRDQMVGPWQTPVADCAVTASGFEYFVGEAMALGERPAVAVIDAPASGRLALAESVTNICAAPILRLSDIALSANWMAACGEPGEDARLFDTVHAVSKLAQELRMPIPVGKDSLSMKTAWQERGQSRRVVSPVSVNITAFAPVADTRRVLTPQLQPVAGSPLLLVDLGDGRNRIGASALAQVFRLAGGPSADLDDAGKLAAFFQGMQLLNQTDLLLAYHDRSDGGLLVTTCEMAFAGRCGMTLELPCPAADVLPFLFNEEPGALLQLRPGQGQAAISAFIGLGLPESALVDLGTINTSKTLDLRIAGQSIYSADIMELHRLWSRTSYHMQALRDHPDCAREDYDRLLDHDDPGLHLHWPDAPLFNAPAVNLARPRVAVLREQGVNGQVEMAGSFTRAGFEAVDVHMSDLLCGDASLADFQGLAAGGGFSYGDVLGAGGGWAKTILYNPVLLEEFTKFFQRTNTFGVGICNGCQMLAHLRDLIPGAAHWPQFLRNRSEQFEARLAMVEILPSPSILFRDMQGARLPIASAHGEGRAHHKDDNASGLVLPVMRFVDNRGMPTERYPANPNGSPGGCTGFTTHDGRFTIVMPHPERTFLSKQFSWLPPEWKREESPWMMLFHNARRWVG
ncbi:MAG: phosphoribosylformylglycinamidine synthase [Gammaproteobacteria bacterium RIFCSPLOWO2_02_FULL_61_13]|nr:MAG: phosphoribosylformylglycinamidine synthase [Gammaproteobacteria bacterium RIFCSPLOWO2_02_FULL_61_13]